MTCDKLPDYSPVLKRAICEIKEIASLSVSFFKACQGIWFEILILLFRINRSRFIYSMGLNLNPRKVRGRGRGICSTDPVRCIQPISFFQRCPEPGQDGCLILHHLGKREYVLKISIQESIFKDSIAFWVN